MRECGRIPYSCTWEPYDNIIGGSEESVQDFHRDNPGQERDPRVKV